MAAKLGAGTAGAGGMAWGLCTSTSVNGYCPGLGAAAARRISTPVGPLEGRLAHPASDRPAADTRIPLRSQPLRRGTQICPIDLDILETVRLTPGALSPRPNRKQRSFQYPATHPAIVGGD